MKHKTPLFILPLLACGVSPQSSAPSFRTHEDCPPGCVCTCEPHASGSSEDSSGSSTSTVSSDSSSTTVSSDSSSSSDESTGSLTDVGAPSSGPVIPTTPGPCPTITDGRVAFDINGTTREVLVLNSTAADSSGPLAVIWHGTYGTPEDWVESHWPTGRILDMIVQENGLLVLPAADPLAVARSSNFPWWPISWDCSVPGEQCDRTDDYDLMDYVTACVVEQGLADPYRISSSGSSAGGILTSYLVGRAQYLAAAVSSSGGVGVGDIGDAANNNVGIMNMHGGLDDVYCDPVGCYAFQEPVEQFALDVASANGCDPNAVMPPDGCAWSFICESPWGGHSWQMSEESAEFLRSSTWGNPAWRGHVWTHDGTAGPPSNPPLPFWAGEFNNNCYRVYETTPHPDL